MEFKNKIEIVNRKARHLYEFVYTLEVGIVLQGTEIKSIRQGKVNMGDAFCRVVAGELLLEKLHISVYELGTYNNHEPLRPRKLLAHKQEIKKLLGRVKEKGFSIVPYRLYLNERGKVKLEIALARGKKSFDKRDSLKQKDLKRDMDRNLKYG
ncbi:SsrA-binding protein SmpB [Saprospira sp. CCB-QB6]|uniref:SsrA-binding protein SmpB n=1 Tax=Saprospira sp. CCB-QB6 TaxID=3023936 RepID=UPI002349B71A|nr:SsrA-binding protein SmpB [Saprospira sp. CCB-QB6]WCL80499.1 SsrA-binding protein SmpB [Saprospira sp. CCB-QB6]